MIIIEVMVSLITIPLKRTYDVDLVKPLKDIANDDSIDNLNSLNKMRANCAEKPLDIKYESYLEMLQK